MIFSQFIKTTFTIFTAMLLAPLAALRSSP